MSHDVQTGSWDGGGDAEPEGWPLAHTKVTTHGGDGAVTRGETAARSGRLTGCTVTTCFSFRKKKPLPPPAVEVRIRPPSRTAPRAPRAWSAGDSFQRHHTARLSSGFPTSVATSVVWGFTAEAQGGSWPRGCDWSLAGDTASRPELGLTGTLAPPSPVPPAAGGQGAVSPAGLLWAFL